MHYDARKLEGNTFIEGDVCIIGAGAAGISMTMDWIDSPFNVILLEGGGFEFEAAMQDLYKNKSTGQRYYPLSAAGLHFFGGTTKLWAGFCSPFDPIDFEKRDWVPDSGWPIRKEDLDPFYEKAHPLLELGPYNYDLNYWREKDPSLAAFALDEKAVYNKVWQFSPPTRFGKKYRDAVVNARNIHLYTHTNVTAIETDENASHVTEVTCKNLQGREHRVRARYFILACNAVQNARLLLASNRIARHGLGNQNDLVGRYFMEHVEINSGKLHLLKPICPRLYQYEIFQKKVRAELALTEQKQEALRVLNGTVSFFPYTAGDPPANINTFPEDAAESVWIIENHERLFMGRNQDHKSKPTSRFNLFTRMEQAPDPNSRITLDQEKDALGVPRVVLHWKLSDLEKRSVRQIYQAIGEQMGLGGLGRVRLDEWLSDESDDGWPATLGGGWHQLGTTRMHVSEKKVWWIHNAKYMESITSMWLAQAASLPVGR